MNIYSVCFPRKAACRIIFLFVGTLSSGSAIVPSRGCKWLYFRFCVLFFLFVCRCVYVQVCVFCIIGGMIFFFFLKLVNVLMSLLINELSLQSVILLIRIPLCVFLHKYSFLIYFLYGDNWSCACYSA